MPTHQHGMVHGHIHRHNDHTHIHGHIHNHGGPHPERALESLERPPEAASSQAMAGWALQQPPVRVQQPPISAPDEEMQRIFDSCCQFDSCFDICDDFSCNEFKCEDLDLNCAEDPCLNAHELHSGCDTFAVRQEGGQFRREGKAAAHPSAPDERQGVAERVESWGAVSKVESGGVLGGVESTGVLGGVESTGVLGGVESWEAAGKERKGYENRLTEAEAKSLPSTPGEPGCLAVELLSAEAVMPPSAAPPPEGSHTEIINSLLDNMHVLLDKLNDRVELFQSPAAKRPRIDLHTTQRLEDMKQKLKGLNVLFPHVHHQHHHCDEPPGGSSAAQPFPPNLTLGTLEGAVGADYQFSFNFNEAPQRCHWNNCHSSIAEGGSLQTHLTQHIDEDGFPDFLCEWNTCNFSAADKASLLAHVNHHGLLPAVRAPPVALTPASPFDEKMPPPLEAPETAGGWLPAAAFMKPEEHRCWWKSANGVCGEVLALAGALTDHLVAHHIGSGASSYRCLWDGCTRCERPFAQRQKILRHIHVHTRHRPFRCSACLASFTLEAKLQQHLRTHSGERPFACGRCSKCFATSTALTVHTRTHTGEKPLECKFPRCSKMFSESSNLAKHMRTHAKAHECGQCSAVFEKKGELSRHAKEHRARALSGLSGGGF